MLRPAMSQIIKKDDSYYRFVVAVAKRAREIAEEAEEEKIPLEENRSNWLWRSLPPANTK